MCGKSKISKKITNVVFKTKQTSRLRRKGENIDKEEDRIEKRKRIQTQKQNDNFSSGD